MIGWINSRVIVIMVIVLSRVVFILNVGKLEKFVNVIEWNRMVGNRVKYVSCLILCY